MRDVSVAAATSPARPITTILQARHRRAPKFFRVGRGSVSRFPFPLFRVGGRDFLTFSLPYLLTSGRLGGGLRHSVTPSLRHRAGGGAFPVSRLPSSLTPIRRSIPRPPLLPLALDLA